MTDARVHNTQLDGVGDSNILARINDRSGSGTKGLIRETLESMTGQKLGSKEKKEETCMPIL